MGTLLSPTIIRKNDRPTDRSPGKRQAKRGFPKGSMVFPTMDGLQSIPHPSQPLWGIFKKIKKSERKEGKGERRSFPRKSIIFPTISYEYTSSPNMIRKNYWQTEGSRGKAREGMHDLRSLIFPTLLSWVKYFPQENF